MKSLRYFLVFVFMLTPHIDFAMCRSIANKVAFISPSTNVRVVKPSTTIQEIMQMFAEKGNTNYKIDEKITQEEHACQAAHIAWVAGADPWSVAAAVLHDIGNFIGPSAGDAQEIKTTHAQRGGDWLKARFPREVYDCAYLHTYAKVWLCKTDPSYFGQLSRASQESYEVQKEQFRDEQVVARSLRGVNFPNIIALRRCDDMAKLLDVKPYGLNVWRIFIQHARKRHKNIPRYTNWPRRVQLLQEMSIKDPDEFVRRVYGGEPKRIEECLGE